MVVRATWTEAFSSFTPAGTSWQDYDIYTNKSVPKGAVALILCASVNDAAARTVGVRTDGSSLSRYIKLHEGEAGGAVTATMFVKVDASTGLIETYCDSTTGITFYLLGYWENVDFTELAADISATSGSTWQDRDVYTNQSVPKNRVVQVLCANRQDAAAATVGVRSDDSSYARYRNLHEAESSSSETTDCQCYSICVKTDDTSGYIEVWSSSTTCTHLLLGYFGYQLGYQDIAPVAGAITSATTWTDWDLTASIEADGQVVEIVCGHNATGVEYNCGARINGSSLSRYVLEHEAESNGEVGSTYVTKTDASGIVEIYCGTSSNEQFDLMGYFRSPEVQYQVTKYSDAKFSGVVQYQVTKYSDARFKKLANQITKTSDAEFRDPNTIYMKSHVIQQTTGAGTNYQVKVIVCPGSGTDSGSTCYMPCSSDFSDVRFYGSTKSPIDAWCESKTDGVSSTWWVEIRDDLSSNYATIYVVVDPNYDYPFGDDQDEMDATFPIADHFYGSAVRSGVWNSSNVQVGSSIALFDFEYAADCYIDSITTPGVGYAIYAYARIPEYSSSQSGDELGLGFSRGSYVARADVCDNRDLCFGGSAYYWGAMRQGTGSTFGTYLSPNLAFGSTWRVCEVKRTSSQCVFVAGSSSLTETDTSKYPSGSIKVSAYSYKAGGSATCYLEVDFILVRKYVDTEPTHGSWGYLQMRVPKDITSDARFKLLATQITKYSDAYFGVPPAWLTGYAYRAKITITGSSDSALTDYPIKLTLVESTGSNSGSTIYLNDHALDWPEDVRFTSDDKVTEIDFWREESDSTDGTWWVEVPAIPISPSTVDIYVYYGKASDSDAIDGEATFTFFDDFSGDLSKWTEVGSPSVSGGILTINAAGEYVKSDNQYGCGTALRGRASFTKTNYLQIGYNDRAGAGTVNNAGFFCYASSAYTRAYSSDAGSYEGANLSDYADSAYHVWEVKRKPSAAGNLYDIDNSNKASHTTEIYSGDLYIYLEDFTNAGTINCDWVLVRKYTTNEPSPSAGSELALTHQISKTSDAVFANAPTQIIKYSDARFFKASNQLTKYADTRFAKYGQQISKTSDARFLKTTQITKYSDAVFAPGTQQVIKYSDARFFKAGNQLSKTADARFAKYGQQISLASNARFLKTTQLTKYGDARLKKLANQVSKSSDARFRKQLLINSDARFKVAGQQVVRYSDTSFKKTTQLSKLSDARFKKTGTQISKASDARFKRLAVQISRDAAARFAKYAQQIGKYSDARLAKYGTQVIKTSDARLAKYAQQLTKLADSRFKKTDIQMSKTSDTRFKRLSEQVVKTADSRFKQVGIQLSKAADTRFARYGAQITKLSDARFGVTKVTYQASLHSDTRFKRSAEQLSRTAAARFKAVGLQVALGSNARFKTAGLQVQLFSASRFRRTEQVAKGSDARFKRTGQQLSRFSDVRFTGSSQVIKTSDALIVMRLQVQRTSDARFKRAGLQLTLASGVGFVPVGWETYIDLDGSVVEPPLDGRVEPEVLEGTCDKEDRLGGRGGVITLSGEGRRKYDKQGLKE